MAIDYRGLRSLPTGAAARSRLRPSRAS